MKAHFSLPLIAASMASALLLTGCQTPGGVREYPQPDASWDTTTGQLRYATPQRSVIGEAIVSSQGNEEFQLDFLAGPGVPLMRLRLSGDNMQAEGLFARGRWNGRANRAGRLGSWATLREAFVSVEGASTGTSSVDQSPAWTAKREKMNAKQERITVDYPKTQERFIFVLPR